MTRTLLIILTLLSSTLSKSQTMTFSQRVNKLFFGIDISNKSSSVLDSFRSIPQLNHSDTGVQEWNLNLSMMMKSDKAWSSLHEFMFTESPLLNLRIEKGIILVTLGETDSTKKLISLNWQLQFNDQTSASQYFDELKKLFGDVATKKKFDYKKDIGKIAQFATRNQVDKGVKDITLLLRKSPTTAKYEIILLFGSDFMDE